MDNLEEIYEWFNNNVNPKINKNFLYYLNNKLKNNFNEDIVKDLLLEKDNYGNYKIENNLYVIKNNRITFINSFNKNNKIINNFKLKLDSKNKTRLIKIN